MKSLLIIFTKNTIIGKVKTRLAKSIGEEKALSVYKKLLSKTKDSVVNLAVEKRVCYSEKLELNDLWENDTFQKSIQKGDDLGKRMYNAINSASLDGYEKICLIGTDIFDLTGQVIEHAFDSLESYDIVLGPSIDGGYYLIGMKSPVKKVFENKKWSTNTVLEDTIADVNKLDLTYALLPELNDVDEINDITKDNQDYLYS